MLSRSTLEMFAEMLDGIQLPAKHPNFEESAARIVTAKKELAAALAEHAEPAPEPVAATNGKTKR